MCNINKAQPNANTYMYICRDIYIYVYAYICTSVVAGPDPDSAFCENNEESETGNLSSGNGNWTMDIGYLELLIGKEVGI